jgi:hypothetical protein
MTSTGIQVEALTPAVENIRASRAWEGAPVRVRGFASAEQRFQVRHLVIFRRIAPPSVNRKEASYHARAAWGRSSDRGRNTAVTSARWSR